MKQTFKVPTSRLPFVQERIAKLNKRAAKNNLLPLTLTVTGTELVRQHPDPLIPEYGVDVEYTVFDVEGETPTIEGWQFIAKIDHSEGVNIVLNVPGLGVKVPKNIVERTPFCDHCKTRRVKKTTYVIAKDSEFMQVGHSCLKDFFDRPVDAQVASLSFWEDLKELEDQESMKFSSVDFKYSVDMVLAVAAASIRQFGFRKSNEDAATKEDVYNWFTSRQPNPLLKPTDADIELAKQVKEWMLAIDEATESDYLSNLRKLATLKDVGSRYFGFLAAAVNSYKLEQQAKKEAEGKADSQWVGEVGKRIELEVTLEKLITKERGGHYGWGGGPYVPTYTYIHIFKDAAGNKITWFGSKIIGDEGETMRIKGTVKDHSEYKGTKDTVLTRVRKQREK